MSDRGDYRYARNVRIGSSDQDNIGAVENLPSTLEISDYYAWNGSAWASAAIPSGTNKTIGHREDFDEGVVYYAVYNSGGNHQILKFSKSERKIYELLKWSGLNFASTNFISMARVNKYLVLTCREAGGDGDVNPPRVINTEDIWVTKSDLSSNFSEFHISFSKWPPLAPPIIKAVDVDYSGGNAMLNKGLFQFCYRYVYYGGMRSTWGPASNFYTIENGQSGLQNVTTFQIIAPGYIYDYENNTYFGHASIKFYEVVEFIEFAFRQSTADSWKLFKRMQTGNFGDNSKFIDFDNNGPVATVDPVEMAQPFDAVPLSSSAVEVIDNRVMFGDNDDDFDIPEFSVEDVEVYSSGTYNFWGGDTLNSSTYSSLSGSYPTVIANKLRPAQFSFKERGIYKLAIQYQHFSGRKSLAISPDNWSYLIPENANFLSGSPGPLQYALGFNIPGSIDPPDWAVGYQILRSNCLNIEFFIEGTANDYKYLGINHSATPAPGTTSQDVQTILNDFANSWNAVKLAEGINDFEARKLLSQQVSTNLRDESEVAALTDAGRIYIDISNWYLQTAVGASQSNPSNNLYYSFRKGDRVRFIGSTGAGYSSPNVKIYDVPIVDFDGLGIIVEKPSDLVTLYKRSSLSNLAAWFQIEVYRPKPATSNDVKPIEYFEIGEWYPITNPLTPSRDFLKRDFRWTSYSTVAAISGSSDNGLDFAWFDKFPVVNGDIHWLKKTMYHTKVGTVSSYNSWFNQMTQDKTDAAGFWEHNEGRPSIAYRYSPINIRKKTQVRFGQKFLEDSIFTAINTFKPNSQFIYPSEYGTIRAMRNTSNAQVESVGNILLILGEMESWSVYVNRSTFQDLGGKTQVGLSDEVLGAYNTLLGSQGTLNPDSVSANNGRVVWWNAKKGVWVRYSRDGLTEISKEGMKNWFKDISLLIIDEYQSATPPKALSVFDNYHDEWIALIDHSSLPATFREYDSYKCASFSERNADKRWKSIYDYAPDQFAWLDNEVYSLIGSKVHIHEAGAGYGSIYGVAVPSQIEFAIGGRKNVDWRAVSTIASDPWSFERIRGDWKSDGATIQESRIPLTSLDELEGTFWAAIKRDMNSPNAASEQAGVISGNPMKSKTLRLLMQLDPDVDYLSVLNWLTVSYTDSPRNPRN